jgi:hypothetical protein
MWKIAIMNNFTIHLLDRFAAIRYNEYAAKKKEFLGL